MKQHSSSEAMMCAKDEALACCRNRRFLGVCDRVLVGLAILSLVRASQALAGEQTPPMVGATKPDFSVARDFPVARDLTAPRDLTAAQDFTFARDFPAARDSATAQDFAGAPQIPPMFAFKPPFSIENPSVPASYRASVPSAPSSFSAAEFRPRGRSLLQRDPGPVEADDPPMLRSTTLWQRLSDYRARDRVRVVTLWETGDGSVSLQAGRKGDPSLQWTSRLMNRGGATRGLLDQAVSASLGGMARSLHLAPRTGGTEAFGRPPKSLESTLSSAGSGAK